MDSIILLVAMIAVFYFLIIRPENKRKKQAENMRNSLKKGERITTIGGLVGRIVQVNDATVVFETSEDRVRIEVAKCAESMEQAAAPTATTADKAEKKAEEKPQTEEEAKTVALPVEDKAEKAEKSEDKPSYDPEIK